MNLEKINIEKTAISIRLHGFLFINILGYVVFDLRIFKQFRV